jgi:hypothetical protein
MGVGGYPPSGALATGLGHGEQDGAVLHCFQAVAAVGHNEEVPSVALPRNVGSCQPHVAVENKNGRLPWIVVLGKPSSSDHADDRLTQHLLMTAEHCICGVATAGRPSQRDLLASESIKGDLLHVISVPGWPRTCYRPTNSGPGYEARGAEAADYEGWLVHRRRTATSW